MAGQGKKRRRPGKRAPRSKRENGRPGKCRRTVRVQCLPFRCLKKRGGEDEFRHVGKRKMSFLPSRGGKIQEGGRSIETSRNRPEKETPSPSEKKTHAGKKGEKSRNKLISKKGPPLKTTKTGKGGTFPLFRRVPSEKRDPQGSIWAPSFPSQSYLPEKESS